MRQSTIKSCPICGKQVRARGYHSHLRLAHGAPIYRGSEESLRRPECRRCSTEGAIVFWSEHPLKFIFRCPRCYRYLGPAKFQTAMSLPLIPGDYEDLEELRREWIDRD